MGTHVWALSVPANANETLMVITESLSVKNSSAMPQTHHEYRDSVMICKTSILPVIEASYTQNLFSRTNEIAVHDVSEWSDQILTISA